VPAERAYFIDDNLQNILAASEVGLNTMHYCGENRNERIFKVFNF
jgi:FMN phosphatase YigB (HAD superfamily)